MTPNITISITNIHRLRNRAATGIGREERRRARANRIH